MPPFRSTSAANAGHVESSSALHVNVDDDMGEASYDSQRLADSYRPNSACCLARVWPVEIILVPGLWLDASSWDAVVPVLEQLGHRARPLTLPGMESRNADRSGITLRDHVDAVVAAIDAADGEVVLVGHSGGGAIAHAAVDARPDRILRAVYVDSWPVGTGGCINDELPSEDGEVPLPDWSFFDDADLVDLDDQLRAAFRARAVPSPLQVAAGRQQLSDERRYDVPITVIACEFSNAQLHKWIAQGAPQLAELAAVRDVRSIELPTGHWPQFTRPRDLGEAIVRAATTPGASGDIPAR